MDGDAYWEDDQGDGEDHEEGTFTGFLEGYYVQGEIEEDYYTLDAVDICLGDEEVGPFDSGVDNKGEEGQQVGEKVEFNTIVGLVLVLYILSRYIPAPHTAQHEDKHNFSVEVECSGPLI